MIENSVGWMEERHEIVRECLGTEKNIKKFRVSGWGREDWEFGVSRCKLLHIGWVNNKILLYSTGNYIQYLLINHNGKDYEK